MDSKYNYRCPRCLVWSEILAATHDREQEEKYKASMEDETPVYMVGMQRIDKKEPWNHYIECPICGLKRTFWRDHEDN